MLDLVSVIIPIYNVFPYLDRCLETVVNQTYKNMEIILIDDGSTDSSLEKCLDWKKKDSRIVLITKQNEGPGITRNLGIKAAHGDYVVFVDADDYIDLTLVEKLHHSVKKYNSEMAFCDIYNVSGNEKHVLIFKQRTIFGKTGCCLPKCQSIYGARYSTERCC